MKNSITTPRFIFITTAILVAAVSRLLPHFYNVTPVAAMALFGGVYLSDKRLAVIVPLLAMFISDLFIGIFHDTLIYVYVSFALTSLIGIAIRHNAKPGTIVIGAVLSSVLFFLITNFGVWAASGMLNGMTGLIETYILGIPFFRNTFIGDLLYNGILFGGFYLAGKKFPVLAKVEA